MTKFGVKALIGIGKEKTVLEHLQCLVNTARRSQVQRRPDEASIDLEALLSEPGRTSKPAKPFSYTPPARGGASPGGGACCRSPSLRASAAPRGPRVREFDHNRLGHQEIKVTTSTLVSLKCIQPHLIKYVLI